MSKTSVFEILFPEIKSAFLEQNRVLAEDATADPLAQTVFIIRQLRAAALDMRLAGDAETADLLEQAAQIKQQQLSQPSQAARAGKPTSIAPELEQMMRSRQEAQA